MQSRQTVDFIYFEAGGGHRSAALALQSVVSSLGYEWNFRLVNLQEVLDPLDVFRKLTGIRLQDLYNLALAKGWTLGSAYLLPLMRAVIQAYHASQVRLLAEYWKRQRPDMVVSLIPNFNRALFESLAQSLSDVPLVTILTDFADYPPHFWMEKQDQYLICGTDRALNQAQAMGYSAERIFRTSGMILRPEFYEPSPENRREELQRLGLRPDLLTGVVLFGGEGSNVMAALADRLGNSDLDLQLILICGKNAEIRARLQRMKTRNRLFVEGFTKQIPYYMRLADFFIGKPGPGSISEALHMRLPVIVECNSWTLPQERYNALWVKEQQVGVVLKNFKTIEPAVKALISSNGLTAMRQRIARMDNRAVFEIPPILDKILKEHAASARVQPALQ